MRPIALSALLLLSACFQPDPLEQCVEQASTDLTAIDALIAETELNLERGYALEADAADASGTRLCARPTGLMSVCAERTTGGEPKPVAINPISERLKLASLRSRRADVAERTEREVAACRAQFGG